MATKWEHEVFVIGSAAAAPGVIAALDAAFPRDDGQPRSTTDIEAVACPMSVTGTDPATHYGASFSITEAIRIQLDGMGLPSTPGVTFWRCGNPSGILMATNHPVSVPFIGQSWTWQQSRDALGLKQIERKP